MAKGNNQKKSKTNDSGLNFEAQLWAAADKMRGHMDASEYNGARPEGLCLGLIFLKYISDAFAEKREQLLFGFSDPKSEWFGRVARACRRPTPGGSRRSTPFPIPTGLHQSAQGCRVREATLGNVIHYFPQPQRGCSNGGRADGYNPFRVDKFSGRFPRVARPSQPWAECRNPVGVNKRRADLPDESRTLKGVLPRDYARPSLDTATRDSAKRNCESHRQDFCGAKDHVRLGGLVDIISNIGFNESAAKSKDVLGRVYEYFLAPWERVPAPAFGGSVQGSPTGRGKFASAEGKGGGEFYTPQCVVQVLVAMLEPYKGRVFDPCCGSGGMFVSSEKFVEEHGGRVGDIAVYGQESNYTTWKLARMNLAIRGIDANLGPRNADSFRADLHPDQGVWLAGS